MCSACSDRLSELAEISGSVKTDWTCPVCGPIRFDKGEDPPEVPAAPMSYWAAIVFYICVAATLIALFTANVHLSK